MALHHSNYCLVTQREGALRDETKWLHQGAIPYALSRLLCRYEKRLSKWKSATRQNKELQQKSA